MKRLYVIVIVLPFAALMILVFTLFLKRYVEKKDAAKLLIDKYMCLNIVVPGAGFEPATSGQLGVYPVLFSRL